MKDDRKRAASGRPAKGERKARAPRLEGKTSGETSGQCPGLIPQEHGGALLAGGQPGHKGGGGRPPNELREWARDTWWEVARPRLLAILNGPDDALALKAAAELRQLGVGNKVEVEAPSTPLVAQFLVGPEVAKGKEQ